MTEPGETDGYSVSDHVRELFSHTGGKLVDYCLVNSEPAPPGVLEKYSQGGAEPVCEDEDAVRELEVELIKAPVATDIGDLARHDPDKLAREILRIFIEKAPTRTYGG